MSLCFNATTPKRSYFNHRPILQMHNAHCLKLQKSLINHEYVSEVRMFKDQKSWVM